MEQFNFNAQLQALEQAGVMDIPYGLSAAKAPEAFPSRALPTNNPRFFATPRPSEGLDAFGPSFQSAQQVDDSRRPVNIVLGNCGNESHLMMLYAKVDRVQSEVQDVKRALDVHAERQERNQEEVKALLNSLKDSLHKFMSNVVMEEQPADTPGDTPGGVAGPA